MIKRMLKWTGVLAVIVVLGALVYADVRYQAVRGADPVELGELSDRFPHAKLYIDPNLAPEAIAQALSTQLGRELPGWILSRTLPHRIAATLEANHDASEIYITVLGSLRRLAPVFLEQLNLLDLLSKVPEVDWQSGAFTSPARGVVFADGALAMEREAEDAVWVEWNHPLYLTPEKPDGGHFVEVILDNRDGGAYLVFASLVEAYDWNLGQQEQDIGLATMKFVHSVRLYMDPQPGDALRMVLAFEILPEAKDRVAIHSIREAVEEGIVELQARLEEHSIPLRGTMEWRDNIMVFEYRLEEFTKALDLLVQGRLL